MKVNRKVIFEEHAMPRRKSLPLVVRFVILVFCLLSVWCSAAVYSQTNESVAEQKEKALALMKQTKYTEALPLLEKIVVAEPQNAAMHYYLASALLGQAANTKDDAARKALRVRARNAFIKSKELGIPEPNIDALIQGLPVDGADAAAFSQNVRANALMVEGEALFSQGRLDEAAQ